MRFTTKKLCVVAALTAMNVALSSFGVPVAGGKIYLNDAVICFAALVVDPFSAFVVGGVGAFLGDLIFYPTPMFVSLVSHGLQAVAISLISGVFVTKEPKLWRAVAAVAVGATIMVAGYTFGKIYVYSTYEYAMLKLPWEILQGAVGAVLGTSLLFATPLKKYALGIYDARSSRKNRDAGEKTND